MNRRSFWRDLLVFALGCFLTRLTGCLIGERITTSRMSPDETLRIRLVDRGPERNRLDRHFVIRLERLETKQTENIYSSPDESIIEGTERFIWSKDGTKVLLVGRHFFVHDELLLDNGDQVYFLYDVKAEKSWFNSEIRQSSPLTADLINGVEFTEPVILKPRAKVDPDSPKKSE